MRETIKLQILTLTLLLILSGCAPVLSTPELATATPHIMPRLDPSPTPSNSTLPLTCQITDLKVRVNEEDGYCFAYPTRFTADSTGLRGPDLDDNLEPVFATFGVEVTLATDTSLREQAEAYLHTFTTLDILTFTWTELTVANEPALMVEPVPTIGAWRFVFIQHHGKLYRLAYWPVDIDIAKTDIEDLTQTTLGSFAFLK